MFTDDIKSISDIKTTFERGLNLFNYKLVDFDLDYTVDVYPTLFDLIGLVKVVICVKIKRGVGKSITIMGVVRDYINRFNQNLLLHDKYQCGIEKVRIDVKVIDVRPQPVKVDINVTDGRDFDGEVVDTMLCIPEVKEIIHSVSKKKGDVFTVVWEDGDKTSVVLMDGDKSDDLTAFMYCMTKKMFGSKGEARKYVAEKKEVFNERVRESRELKKQNRERLLENKKSREEVPYAGGLISPQLSLPQLPYKGKR